jgi:uncharacterized membrane protein YadS
MVLVKSLGPGLLLYVSLLARFLHRAENYFAGQSYVEALVLAILLGLLLRAGRDVYPRHAGAACGIHAFSCSAGAPVGLR